MWRAIKLILFRANSNQISWRQHCMKWSEDRWLLRAYTLTWLSVRISKVQPCNRACHNFKDTRMLSNSNWLMFSFLAATKGGNGAWTISPKQTAPHASRQASNANKSGFETITLSLTRSLKNELTDTKYSIKKAIYYKLSVTEIPCIWIKPFDAYIKALNIMSLRSYIEILHIKRCANLGLNGHFKLKITVSSLQSVVCRKSAF